MEVKYTGWLWKNHNFGNVSRKERKIMMMCNLSFLLWNLLTMQEYEYNTAVILLGFNDSSKLFGPDAILFVRKPMQWNLKISKGQGTGKICLQSQRFTILSFFSYILLLLGQRISFVKPGMHLKEVPLYKCTLLMHFSLVVFIVYTNLKSERWRIL